VIKRWTTILWVCFLVACTARPALLPAPKDVLPTNDAVSGWQEQGHSATYDRGTLHGLMEDEADLCFAYGFEELAVGQYANADGDVVQVDVYRLATDADAYGLFAYSVHGESIDLGVDGELEKGHRLAFWQSRTFVQIVAQSQVDDNTLRAFGKAVSSALPDGGERPFLVEALPAEGMRPGSARFFRKKVALDKLLWMGSEDVLGLGTDTDGVLAHYETDGQRFDLILIAFPTAARAQAARSGLIRAGIEDLMTTGIKGRMLGAVFGQVDEETATEPGCACSSDEIPLMFGKLPEETAKELLDKAMAALP